MIVPALQSGEPKAVHEAFTPTQPCHGHAALVGRQREIETIHQGLTEDKAHIVLYADRGWGKTSLANIVVENLRSKGLVVARTQAEAGSTFDTVARGLVRTLPISLLTTPVRFDTTEGCEAALPATAAGPDDVVTLMSRLRLDSLICVVDEFDRVTDPQSRTMLADTIKQLSDRRIPLLFMIIGVSGSLEQLLGQHPSIQRNVIGVGLPLLSDDDIGRIIKKGAAEAQLTIPGGLVSSIAATSRGLPYVAHLLGLRTAQAAVRRRAPAIERKDLMTALTRLASETPPRIVGLYEDVTAGEQDRVMVSALKDIANSVQDRWGRMQVVGAGADGVVVGGARVPKSCFLTLVETGVLRSSDGKPNHVSFSERTLLHYILVKTAEQEQLTGSPPTELGERTGRQPASSGDRPLIPLAPATSI